MNGLLAVLNSVPFPATLALIGNIAEKTKYVPEMYFLCVYVLAI